MEMIIETVLSIEELEEIRKKAKADVEIVLIGIRKGRIPLNVVRVKGKEVEVHRFLERLRLARAGG